MKCSLIARILLLSIIISPITPAAQAQQSETPSSLVIDSLILSRCGTQFAYASGTASYSTTDAYLSVRINGTDVLNTASKPAAWVSNLLQVSPGTHLVTARIATDGTLATILAVESRTFTVPECSSSDPGDEKDCCPGPDPAAPSEQKGKVAGITTSAKEVRKSTPQIEKPSYNKVIAAEVFNISETEIELVVSFEPLKTIKLKITKDTVMKRYVERGSAVQVHYHSLTRQAIRITNVAPNDQLEYFGGVDCDSCGT